MGIVQEAHNVKVLGSGEQVIVLSHGFGSDQSVWRYLMPYLVQDFKVVLYDNTGAGTTNPDYYDFERYSTVEGIVYDLLAILEELQVKSCIFIGHSAMSLVGAIASVSRPDLFSKIIMLSATPRLLNDGDYQGGFERQDREQFFEAMRSNYESWCLGFAPLFVGGDMDSEAVQEFCRTLFNMRPDIALSLAKVKILTDTRHILPMVTIPCHILPSVKDMAVPVSVPEYLHRNRGAQSIVEVMPTRGQLPQIHSTRRVSPRCHRDYCLHYYCIVSCPIKF